MARLAPHSQQVTVWRAEGRWFQRRVAAYYAIAKRLTLEKYPRWLGEHDLDDKHHVLVDAEDGTPATIGDLYAEADGIADWRARKARRDELFVTRCSGSYDEPAYEGFDTAKWSRFVRRVARFLMFVDDRRAELTALAEPGVIRFDPKTMEIRTGGLVVAKENPK